MALIRPVPFARQMQTYFMANGTITAIANDTVTMRLDNGNIARGVRVNAPLVPYLSEGRRGTLYYDEGSWILFSLIFKQEDAEQGADALVYTLSESIEVHAHDDAYAPIVHSHAYASAVHTHDYSASGHTHAPQDAYTQAAVDGLLAALALDDLADVDAVSPADTEALLWNDGTGKWTPGVPVVGPHDHDSDYYTQSALDTILSGKSATGHIHDDRYYTESEIDSALSGKSATGHTHTTVRTLSFGFSGTLVVGGLGVRLPVPAAGTITNIVVTVGTQPTGASVIVDVNKGGTTLFTTQGNRPTIAVSTNDDLSSVPDVTSLAVDDILTCDVDQIGSTIAGANLLIQIRYTVATG